MRWRSFAITAVDYPHGRPVATIKTAHPEIIDRSHDASDLRLSSLRLQLHRRDGQVRGSNELQKRLH